MPYIKWEIHKFHPTQITVGMKEVEEKKAHIEKLTHGELHTYREEHVVPVVIGPEWKYFIIDHHHFVLALELANHDHCYCKIVKDLSTLPSEIFWKKMNQARWVHPYDENGKKRAISEIPSIVKKLKDDPYRSLAAFVRNTWIFKKTLSPFAEFEWADFFRKHIAKDFIHQDFDKSIFIAMWLADSLEAKHLPGWIWKIISNKK